LTDSADMEGPAITDLQAAAEEFNAAFNTALYELETSRKTAVERANRITELDASINTINSALNEEVTKNHRIEEEFRLEIEQLQQRLQSIESERNDLLEQFNENEKTLQTRSEQATQLSSQVEELSARLQDSDGQIADLNSQVETLSNDLNSRITASEQLQQEYNQETARLGAEIQQLQGDLQSKAELLEQRDNKLESATSEATSLNKQISDLHAEIQTQSNAIKVQSEAHARSNDEMEARIITMNNELESMRTVQTELEAHAEKLENLNRALHESTISESGLHKKVVEEKDSLIESLLTKLTLASDAANGQIENTAHVDELRSEQTEGRDNVAALRNEVEKLRSALSASEEQREELQTSLADIRESSSNNGPAEPLLSQLTQPVAATADRNRFIAHLNALLAAQSDADKNHTVMYILLDNFVRVRDEIGIMHSEYVIKEISDIIASFCEDGDIISRFGDCTFAILSHHESTDETREKAEQIRSTIEHHIFEVAGHSMIISTSIGICKIRDNDTSADGIISRADLSCEAARSSGGNKVMVNSAVTEELIIMDSNVNHEEMISAALTEDRMMIYYQPISSLQGNPGNYFEILVRIVDENGAIILPGEFFSMAEATGQAVDIDLYIIEKVMHMMSENRDREVTLFIKLTRHTVADHDFPLWVVGKIKEYQIDPEKLVFEVTENTLQSNLKNLSMLSKALHAIGCKIAIEHYQLSTKPQHLLHIHIDYLKIDSSLVENISRKGESLEKVSSIMDIARKNDYITIAEGVENPANLAILWELGVSLAQGYFIQAPADNCDFDFQDIVSVQNEEENRKSVFAVE
jgi:diguanylate cyclase (GGDEF)-like protein